MVTIKTENYKYSKCADPRKKYLKANSRNYACGHSVSSDGRRKGRPCARIVFLKLVQKGLNGGFFGVKNAGGEVLPLLH